MLVAVTPDTFAAEFRKLFIAAPRPLVPAFGDIMPDPIMPPIDIAIWLPFFFPSMMPSAASLIIAVTMDAEFAMPRVLAYSDMAANVMP